MAKAMANFVKAMPRSRAESDVMIACFQSADLQRRFCLYPMDTLKPDWE